MLDPALPPICPVSSVDDRTIEVYARLAERYVDEIAMTLSGVGPLEETFLRALPPGRGQVLDWGAGPGQTSGVFTAAGLSVVSTDACPDMARIARELGVTVRVEPFEALAPDPARFRGIWAMVSLCHVGRPLLPGLLNLARRAMLPGGVIFVGMKVGPPDRREGRDRLGRYLCYWTRVELVQVMLEADFQILSSDETVEVSFDRGSETYANVLACRA